MSTIGSASRDKGARAENQAKGLLKRYTNLDWQRVPASGALAKAHLLKGDLYVPPVNDNIYCVEVKHYKEDKISSKLLTDTTPQLIKWWDQSIRQAEEVNKDPLLIFKFDRSKFFVCFDSPPPNEEYSYLFYSTPPYMLYIAKLEDWLSSEKVRFMR
jgi:hypothetical protein